METERTIGARGALRNVLMRERCGTQITGCVGNEEEEDDCERRSEDCMQKEAI